MVNNLEVSVKKNVIKGWNWWGMSTKMRRYKAFALSKKSAHSGFPPFHPTSGCSAGDLGSLPCSRVGLQTPKSICFFILCLLISYSPFETFETGCIFCIEISEKNKSSSKGVNARWLQLAKENKQFFINVNGRAFACVRACLSHRVSSGTYDREYIPMQHLNEN